MEKKDYTQKTLRSLVYDLETGVGSIGLNLETLNDVNTVLGQLRIKMDNVKFEDKQYYVHEWHTAVRLLDDLIHYTVKDLNANYGETKKIKEEFFDTIVRQEATQ